VGCGAGLEIWTSGSLHPAFSDCEDGVPNGADSDGPLSAAALRHGWVGTFLLRSCHPCDVVFELEQLLRRVACVHVDDVIGCTSRTGCRAIISTWDVCKDLLGEEAVAEHKTEHGRPRHWLGD
jgi:hypothetical protein